METNLCGDGWGWNGSSAGTGGDGCNFGPCAGLYPVPPDFATADSTTCCFQLLRLLFQMHPTKQAWNDGINEGETDTNPVSEQASYYWLLSLITFFTSLCSPCMLCNVCYWTMFVIYTILMWTSRRPFPGCSVHSCKVRMFVSLGLRHVVWEDTKCEYLACTQKLTSNHLNLPYMTPKIYRK